MNIRKSFNFLALKNWESENVASATNTLLIQNYPRPAIVFSIDCEQSFLCSKMNSRSTCANEHLLTSHMLTSYLRRTYVVLTSLDDVPLSSLEGHA